MEGKPRASVAKHLWEGTQVSAKVFNSSLILALGLNLRDLECLELNNNNRLLSSEVRQLLVNNNRNHQLPYLEHNLLKQGLALGKIKVEISLADSDSRSSNPSLGSNSSRHLSLVNSHSNNQHSGSSNPRWVSKLSHYLGLNQLSKPILCLADKLKGQVPPSLEVLQGLEPRLEHQDSK